MPDTMALGNTVYNVDSIPMTSGVEKAAAANQRSLAGAKTMSSHEEAVAESAIAKKLRLEAEAQLRMEAAMKSAKDDAWQRELQLESALTQI